MNEFFFGKEFDENIVLITTLSREWFLKNSHKDVTMQFCMYIEEAKNGHLGRYYPLVLDETLECITGVLPIIVSRLISAIDNVIVISRSKLRQMFSMIVYWLIQFHSDDRRGMPDKIEIHDIIDSILNTRLLSFR